MCLLYLYFRVYFAVLLLVSSYLIFSQHSVKLAQFSQLEIFLSFFKALNIPRNTYKELCGKIGHNFDDNSRIQC